MSDIDSPGRLPALNTVTDLVVSQWSRERAPVFRRFLDEMLGVRTTGTEGPLSTVELQANIDTATGIGLDWIGDRLGLPRPGIRSPLQVFGFRPEDARFDQGPFADALVTYTGESPVGDNYYRRMLKARAIQVTTNASLVDLTAMTNALFGESRWVTVEGGVVALEACSTDFQMYQTARRVGLLNPPPGVERKTIWGPWALIPGRNEILRVAVEAGGSGSDIFSVGSSLGDIEAVDDILNDETGNSLTAIHWDGTDTLTIDVQGSGNDLVAWLANNSALEASALLFEGNSPGSAGDHEESSTITAPTDDSLAIEFSATSFFDSVVSGSRFALVIADNGTVETTGDVLYMP